MVGRQAMRWLFPGLVAAVAAAPACRAQALQTQAQPALPAEAAPPAVPAQPMPPVGSPVFVIYPANPPSRATILLNTVTGETWLLGVSGPDGQYQWTHIAVADPSETATAPR